MPAPPHSRSTARAPPSSNAAPAQPPLRRRALALAPPCPSFIAVGALTKLLPSLIHRIALLILKHIANPSRPSGSPIRSSSRRFTGSSGSKPSFPISYLNCLLPRVSYLLDILYLFVYPIYSIVQRVGAVEVLFAVVSQLGAKLASTDRGQASKVIVGS